MEQVNTQQNQLEIKNQIDRVILGKEEAKIIETWQQNLNSSADGLIKYSKADVVNFLIRNHDRSFGANEVQQLARESYDETKWLGWALTKIKRAKKTGAILTFDDLIKFRDALMGGAPSLKRKKKAIQTVTENSEAIP